MRKLPMGAVECRGFPIHYALLVETLEDNAEVYGISVEYRAEEVTLPAVTACRRKAEELLALLRRGSVTPATVQDVAEDWLLA